MRDLLEPDGHSELLLLIPRTDRSRRVPAGRPLPDAMAIRLVPVPENAPPYDGDVAGAAAEPVPAARSLRLVSTAGAVPAKARTAPVGPVPASWPPSPAPRPAPPGPAPLPGSPGPALRAGPPGSAPRPAPARPAARPAPARPGQDEVAGSWPGRFAQVLAETLAGSRPPEQIAAWTTEQARRRIRQLGPLLAATHRPRVRRVIVTSPAGGVLEMTVIVGVGPRVRAVAVRLERTTRPHFSPGPPGLSISPSSELQPPQPPAPQPPPAQGPSPTWLCTAVEAG